MPWISSGARDFVNLWDLAVHVLLSALSRDTHLSGFGLLIRMILRVRDEVIDPGLISFELLSVILKTRSLSEL